MLKKYRTLFIISSVITLLPMPIGLLLWSKLPETLAVHFDANGVPNGYNSRSFVVFMIPLLMLLFHIICICVVAADPKKQNISEKVFSLIFWIIPACSLFLAVSIYGDALGNKFDLSLFVPLFIGVLFIIIGNYLPKTSQNYTVGIKLPWTLNSVENWNHTHRFAAWVFIVCGILTIACAFLFNSKFMLAIILICAFAPLVYSFVYYLRHDKKS